MAFNKPNVNTPWASTGAKVEPTLAKKQQGWIAEIPPFEFENWIQNRQDQYIAHSNQYGVAVWDRYTEYLNGKSYVQGSDGVIYKAKQDNINTNPVTDTNNVSWEPAFTAYDFSYSKSMSDGLFLKKSSNLSDLSSAASARSNLSVYSKSEADGRFLNETSNLSDLSNASVARDNLGLGDLAVKDTADLNIAYLKQASNLSDIPNKVTARNNLSVYSKSEADSRYMEGSNNLSDVSDTATARDNLLVYSKLESDDRYLAKDASLNLDVYSRTESDSRYLKTETNLSDVANTSLARSNLGLGDAATKDVGIAAGDVLQRSDADSIYMQGGNNLSEISNAFNARSNLSVYSKTEVDSKFNSLPSIDSYSKSEVYNKNESDSRFLNESDNLRDVPDKGTARSNLDVYSRSESDSRYGTYYLHWGQEQITRFLNDWSTLLNYSVPEKCAMTGLYAYHLEHHDDRRFKIKYRSIELR